MKVGDLVYIRTRYPDKWSGTVGLVVGVRAEPVFLILVLGAPGRCWMRPDAAEVINANR